jgi:serine/threonine-protein kinase
MARHLYQTSRDYDRARKELLAARTALPNEPLVYILAGYINRRQGRWEESTKELQKALELDPRNVAIVQQGAYNYQYLRRFKEIAEILDRLAMINSKDVTNRLQRGLIDIMWKADARPLHVTIQSIVTEDPNTELTISNQWMYLALCERDKSTAEHILHIKDATDACRDDAIPFPLAWCEGVAYRTAGDANGARTAFNRARAEVELILQKQPDYAEQLCVLGMIDAALGKKEDAIREGRRAVELLPISKDAMNSPKLSKYLTIIYAWVGEKKTALDELTKLSRMPSDVNYGDLRLNPYWDPLRGDRHFEKIVASLAPDAKQK